MTELNACGYSPSPLRGLPSVFLYERHRGVAYVRVGDESDEHLSGDVISSERWWPAPAVSAHWGTVCSTCLKALQLAQLEHRTGLLLAFVTPPVMKSTEVKRARQRISGRAWVHTARLSCLNKWRISFFPSIKVGCLIICLTGVETLWVMPVWVCGMTSHLTRTLMGHPYYAKMQSRSVTFTSGGPKTCSQ